MKNYIIILILGLSLNSWGQLFNPQPKEVTEKFFPEIEADIPTPAFDKVKGFTTYDEMMDFLNPLVNQNQDQVKLSFIGESQKGLKVPMLKFFEDNTQEKIKVWIQAGIHGDEPASTEGILYLIYELLNNPEYNQFSKHLEIAIVPMANVDGYNRQLRDAINGLDLNRDQTKLNIKESLFLKQTFTDFNAHVALDFHEYRPFRRDFVHYAEYGITNPNEVMFLYSGNLNVPENLRNYTENNFVDEAKSFLKQKNIRTFDYFSTSDCQGYTCFNLGSINARSSATSYALANTISTLVEVRGVALGRTSYKRRTLSTFWVAINYLKSSIKNKEDIPEIIESAIASKHDVVVQSKRKVSKQPIELLDLAKNEIYEEEVILRNALKSIPTLTRQRPTAYILLPSEKEAVKRLKVLGLNVKELSQDTELEVEQYKITAYRKSLHKYEGVKRQHIKTEIETVNKTIPKGSFVIEMNQRHANLAVETLEPEADNSFISFNVISTQLNDILPYYRYLNDKTF